MNTRRTRASTSRRSSKPSVIKSLSKSRSITPKKSVNKSAKNLGLKEQIAEKLDCERIEDHHKANFNFCEKKAAICLNKGTKQLIELFENANGLFTNLPEYSNLDSLKVLEKLRTEALHKNRTYKRLKSQCDLLA